MPRTEAAPPLKWPLPRTSEPQRFPRIRRFRKRSWNPPKSAPAPAHTSTARSGDDTRARTASLPVRFDTMIPHFDSHAAACVCPATAGPEKIMSSFPKLILVFILCLAASLPSAAQSPLSGMLQSSPTTGTPNSASDPLGRTTPQSTVLGFLHAAQSGDYGIAAHYLQMTAARPQSEGEQLARKLDFVL